MAAGSVSRSYRLYHLVWAGLDLLLPPTCAGCGGPGSRWCEVCRQNITTLVEPLCEVCGIPCTGTTRVCPDCGKSRPHFGALRSWAVFAGAIRLALHRLKYRRDLGLGEALTPQLTQFASGFNYAADLLVPVPLGKGRLGERGYNQVSLIARPLSMALGVTYAPDALTRTRETRSQVGLTKAERRTNVNGAFQAKPNRVDGRRILLLDDIATTGSTLSSCAEALRAAGARDVFALTVARAFGRRSLAGV